jgi:hypothetical protein
MYTKKVPGPIVGAEYGLYRAQMVDQGNAGDRLFMVLHGITYDVTEQFMLNNPLTRLPDWLANEKSVYIPSTNRTVRIRHISLGEPTMQIEGYSRPLAEFLDDVSTGYYVKPPLTEVWLRKPGERVCYRVEIIQSGLTEVRVRYWQLDLVETVPTQWLFESAWDAEHKVCWTIWGGEPALVRLDDKHKVTSMRYGTTVDRPNFLFYTSKNLAIDAEVRRLTEKHIKPLLDQKDV